MEQFDLHEVLNACTLDTTSSTNTMSPEDANASGLVVGVAWFTREMSTDGENLVNVDGAALVLWSGEGPEVQYIGILDILSKGGTARMDALRAKCAQYIPEEMAVARCAQWLETRRAEAEQQANNAKWEAELAEMFEARKGRKVLVIKGDAMGTVGRVFWIGMSGGRYPSERVGVDAGGPRDARGFCQNPTWLTIASALAIPSDFEGLFDPKQRMPKFALAMADLLEGRTPAQQHSILSEVAASEEKCIQLGMLGEDFAQALDAWEQVKNAKGKGSSTAKRVVSEALSAIRKRMSQIVGV